MTSLVYPHTVPTHPFISAEPRVFRSATFATSTAAFHSYITIAFYPLLSFNRGRHHRYLHYYLVHKAGPSCPLILSTHRVHSLTCNAAFASSSPAAGMVPTAASTCAGALAHSPSPPSSLLLPARLRCALSPPPPPQPLGHQRRGQTPPPPPSSASPAPC